MEIAFYSQHSCSEGCKIPELAESQGDAGETEQAADHRSCEHQLLHGLVTKRAPKMCLGWIPPANPKRSWTGCTYSKNPTEALAELWGETVCVHV